jgi:O-antigen/teichoic acid export membrane protein
LALATGDWLTVLAFGSAGEGTGAILGALAVSALMNGIGVVAGNGLWAIDQPRPNFLADVFSMAVTLIAAALLVLPFGALGAALATLAGMTAAAVVRTITLVRFLRRVEAEPHATGSVKKDHSTSQSLAEASHYLVETAEAAI